MLYKALLKMIQAGEYVKDDMQNRLDIFFACGRITAEQYQELIGLMDGQPADQPAGE